jgi:hypothetical protein
MTRTVPPFGTVSLISSEPALMTQIGMFCAQGLDIYFVSPKVTFQGEFVPTITAVRGFTDDPILLTGTAVPDQSGQVRQIADLFAGLAPARPVRLRPRAGV